MDARTEELPLAQAGPPKPIAQSGPPQRPAPEQGFDWSPDNPDVVLPEQPATAVYMNPWGQVVIRQERAWNDEDDSYVRISLHNVQCLIDRLQAVMQAQ